MKRAFDLMVVVIIGLIAAPIALVVALAVKLEGRGPIVVGLERVGQSGKRFQHYRFRTMAGTPLRKTRLGRIIGNLSLDDLPTLWNVIKGDLSVVGPRPEAPDQVDLDDPRWQQVLSVKPGLIGLGILTLREHYHVTSVQERLKPEVTYVERQSLWLDMRLLLRTIYWWLRMGHIKGRF